MMQSKRFELNETDWFKIVKGAVIAAIGAALTYLASELGLIDVVEPVQVVGDTVDGELVVDGVITPYIVVTLISTIVNVLRLFWRDN